MLKVPDSTRALLEEITHSFDAPIRYAFAYGSGVFTQKGYSETDVCSMGGSQYSIGFLLTHSSIIVSS